MADDRPDARLEVRAATPLAELEKVSGLRTNPNSISRVYPGDTWGSTVYDLKDRRIPWPPS